VRALLVADAHLAGGDDPRGDALAALIGREAAPGARLVVLGDLFDAWCGAAGPGTRPCGPVLDAVLAWGRDGGPVDWLEGNHDFHLGGALGGGPGLSVHPGPVDTVWDGIPIHLAHGDEVNRADRGYRLLRRLFRSRGFHAGARALGPRFALAVGGRLARASREGGRGRDGDWDGAVASWARDRHREGARMVAVGHGHRLGISRPGGEGTALVQLGEWWSARSYARWDGGSLALCRLRDGGAEEVLERVELAMPVG